MVCCVTGHRPSGFYFSRDVVQPITLSYYFRLINEIENLILQGVDVLITGMADGADIDFANMVIMLKRKYNFISLEAALPFPINPPKKYEKYHKERGFVLSQCDKRYIVSEYYHKGCMEKRNRFMVDRADVVLAIWNGKEFGGTWNTIKYARSKGKEIRYLMIDDLDNFELPVI